MLCFLMCFLVNWDVTWRDFCLNISMFINSNKYMHYGMNISSCIARFVYNLKQLMSKYELSISEVSPDSNIRRYFKFSLYIEMRSLCWVTSFCFTDVLIHYGSTFIDLENFLPNHFSTNKGNGFYTAYRKFSQVLVFLSRTCI